MSSAPLVTNLLKTVSQDADSKTSSSSKAGHEHVRSEEAFYATLQRALKGEAAKIEKTKVQEKQPTNKEKQPEDSSVRAYQESGSSNNDAFSSVQAALMMSGQIPAQTIESRQASKAMSDAYEQAGKGASAKAKTSAWNTASSNIQGVTGSLSEAGGNAAFSVAGASTGVGSLASNTIASQDFSNLLDQFGKSGGKMQALSELTGTPSSHVSLSINGLSSLNASALQPEQNPSGALALPLKEVQAALKDYWVSPVQVSSQSPTEATVRMNLRDGGVLTLHFQLSEGQGAQLRVEAPAAALAALQARLAPLQESLLQQGLTLAPIQWGTAKTPSGRGAGASDSVKGRLMSSAVDQLEKDKLSELTEDVVYATTAAEDLLE